jgi:hypothetical protein
MKSILWYLSLLVTVGCGNFTKTTIYNETTYDKLKSEINIRVKNIDGHITQFYRMEIVKVDEMFIYAHCWEKKGSKPVDYKFKKSEIVIENTKFSGTHTGEYLLYLGILVTIVVLIQLAINRHHAA